MTQCLNLDKTLHCHKSAVIFEHLPCTFPRVGHIEYCWTIEANDLKLLGQKLPSHINCHFGIAKTVMADSKRERSWLGCGEFTLNRLSLQFSCKLSFPCQHRLNLFEFAGVKLWNVFLEIGQLQSDEDGYSLNTSNLGLWQRKTLLMILSCHNGFYRLKNWAKADGF